MNAPSVSPLRLGMIPYWNLLPLAKEMSRLHSQNMVVRTGVPAVINSLLDNKEVDIAPCSSVCLINQSGFEMALPLGVACDGAVKSVYLGLHHEHEYLLERIHETTPLIREIFSNAIKDCKGENRKIAQSIWTNLDSIAPMDVAKAPALKLSKSSASGAVLTRILYRMWFGDPAYQTHVNRQYASNLHPRKPIELLIGDEALIQKRRFFKIIDLGSTWKDLTQLPFVFAVWQSKGACLNGWRRKILNAGELAERKMKIDASSYFPEIPPVDDMGKKINLQDYWKVINYKLGPKEFKGLLLFLCLTRQLQAMPLDQSFIVKLMRWQEISQSGTIPQL